MIDYWIITNRRKVWTASVDIYLRLYENSFVISSVAGINSLRKNAIARTDVMNILHATTRRPIRMERE